MGFVMNDKDFTRIPVEEAVKPFEGAVVYMNRYWIVQDGNILLYKGRSPQCNHQKVVVEKSLQKLYPNSEVKFLEVVYLDMIPVLVNDAYG